MGGYIKGYTTLQAAKAACSNDIECGCIYDSNCDGGTWSIHKGSDLTSGQAHGQENCAWTRGKF